MNTSPLDTTQNKSIIPRTTVKSSETSWKYHLFLTVVRIMIQSTVFNHTPKASRSHHFAQLHGSSIIFSTYCILAHGIIKCTTLHFEGEIGLLSNDERLKNETLKKKLTRVWLRNEQKVCVDMFMPLLGSHGFFRARRQSVWCVTTLMRVLFTNPNTFLKHLMFLPQIYRYMIQHIFI